MTAQSESQTQSLKVLVLDHNSCLLKWVADLQAAGTGLAMDILRLDDLVQAQEMLSRNNYDLIVVQASLQTRRELGFLREVQKHDSSIVRILIGDLISPALAAQALEVAHNVIPSSLPLKEVLDIVQKARTVGKLVHGAKVTRYVDSLKKLPSAPSVYRELTAALNSDRTSAGQISKIVEQDPALTAKLLQLVNSAYFGLSRQITRIPESVTMLGVQTIRSLALSSHLNSHYPQDKSWKYFSFEAVNSRSLMVARLAQDIARDASEDSRVADQAFLAGLLLDIGSLILASHNPAAYHKLMVYTAKKKVRLYRVEKKALGFDHAEVGAHLLDRWQLPPQVVDAVLLHHQPALSTETAFSVLSAVHVADSLIPSVSNQTGCEMGNKLSEPYLEQIGCDKDIHRWQMLANKYRRKMVVGE